MCVADIGCALRSRQRRGYTNFANILATFDSFWLAQKRPWPIYRRLIGSENLFTLNLSSQVKTSLTAAKKRLWSDPGYLRIALNCEKYPYC